MPHRAENSNRTIHKSLDQSQMMEEYRSGTRLDFAPILEKVGKWQVIQFLLLTASTFSTAFNMMGILLIGYQPPFRCASPLIPGNNSSLKPPFDDKCIPANTTFNESVACPHGFEYEGGKHVSFVSEWDLVCDNGYLADLSQTIFLLGTIVGANVVSHIADRFGRKPLLLLAGFAKSVLFFVLAFIPNFTSFILLRFLLGFCGMGIYDVKVVLIMEMFPIRLRGTMVTLDGLSWAIAVTLLASLGYPLHGLYWRHVQLILLSSFVIFISYFFFLDESVRWLVANGKHKQARTIIRKIQRMNGIQSKSTANADSQNEKPVELLDVKENLLGDSAGDHLDQRTRSQLNPGQSYEKERVVQYNVLDILKHRRTRFVFLAMCIVWFADSLIYYGLFLMTTAMSGDRLLNVLLSAAVEIPAMAGLYACTRWLGRRRGSIGLHLACGIALLSSVVFSLTTDGDANDVLMKIVSVIGKFSISASFMLLYFYTPELLPTNFRAAGLGIASGAAKTGSLLSPFASTVFRKAPWAPGVVFGGFAVLVSGLLIFMPETEDKELPQHLEDIDRWAVENKNETVSVTN